MKYHYNCSTICQKTVQEKTETTIKTTTYYYEQIIQEETHLIGKVSSIAYVYSPVISDEPKIDYSRISYLRHNTLYTKVWDLPENGFIIPNKDGEEKMFYILFNPESTTPIRHKVRPATNKCIRKFSK